MKFITTFMEQKLTVAQLVKKLPPSLPFMEPKGSLPCSHHPLVYHLLSHMIAPHHRSYIISLIFVLILSCHLCLWLSTSLFTSGFPT